MEIPNQADLLREHATADMMGVRHILSLHQTVGLSPAKLARILRQADEGNADAYLSLAEELEEKDTHYISVIGTRKRAVAQLDISVEPGGESPQDKENAALVEAFLKRDCLESEVFHMLDAVGKGYSVMEIIWELSADTWMPKDLKYRDPRWFEFNQTDGETLQLKKGAERVPLQPYKFVVHKHQSKSGIPIRGGVVRPCVWMWLFKNFSIKDWVIFAEAYGQPIRIGKYNSGASPADKDILMRAVASIGSDAAAIIPESMKIEFIEAQGKTGSSDVFQRLANFCDQQISKAVLGQTTTTDAISGGHAVSKEHNDVRGDIERSDAKQLAATLNEQLVKPLIDLNKGPQKSYPKIKIGRPEEIDIDKFSQTVERSVKSGIKISMSKTREQLGLHAPIDDDDILVAPAAAPQLPPPQTEKSTAAEARPVQRDAIDIAVDEQAAEYEEILNPIIEGLEKAAASSNDFEEFKQQLLSLSKEMDISSLSDRLAKASFMSRLAGNLEVDLNGEDDGSED